MMEARYYERLDDALVHCHLCPHQCTIATGQRGHCRTRYNNNGMLQTLNYGQCTSIALDPIEKKPLYHFHPHSHILSLGSWGCNLTCSFCQNWQISQAEPAYETVTSERIVELATQLKARGNIGVAYTYNEPTVWYEFIRQTAPLVHQAGLYNVMVTNGYIETAPLEELLPFIDAWNIDLKAFDTVFYKKLCGASLDPVKRTIATAAKVSHVEVTNLVVTGENDKVENIEKMAQWIASINPAIPLHLSRYFPRYKWTAPATPIETLREGASRAEKYLQYVHLGNI
jgi:pyruvate formate lyase activating enzyme